MIFWCLLLRTAPSSILNLYTEFLSVHSSAFSKRVHVPPARVNILWTTLTSVPLSMACNSSVVTGAIRPDFTNLCILNILVVWHRANINGDNVISASSFEHFIFIPFKCWTVFYILWKFTVNRLACKPFYLYIGNFNQKGIQLLNAYLPKVGIRKRYLLKCIADAALTRRWVPILNWFEILFF